MQTHTHRTITLDAKDHISLLDHSDCVQMSIFVPGGSISIELQPCHIERLELLIEKLRAIESGVTV